MTSNQREKNMTTDESRIRLVVAGALVIACTLCSAPVKAQVIKPASGQGGSLAAGARLMLRDGWKIQTSSGQEEGDAISQTGFAATNWYPTVIPASVAGVLGQAGVYPDP